MFQAHIPVARQETLFSYGWRGRPLTIHPPMFRMPLSRLPPHYVYYCDFVVVRS